MNSTHNFEIEAWNSPSILPRISLVLSRRRLTPTRMQFEVGADERFCRFTFDLECDRSTADRLAAQFARLVELVEIAMHPNAPQLHAANESDAPAPAAA